MGAPGWGEYDRTHRPSQTHESRVAKENVANGRCPHLVLERYQTLVTYLTTLLTDCLSCAVPLSPNVLTP